jgi:hypothetical protein
VSEQADTTSALRTRPVGPAIKEEYAAYHRGTENHGAENGKTEEAHVEEGVLYQRPV